MSFAGQNILVLDLEIANSPDTVPDGWKDKAALGLSVGACYDYQDGIVHWFDQHTVLDFIFECCDRKPMLVSFNGIGFDFALMRAVVRQQAINDGRPLEQCDETALQVFRGLAETSYDILAEIWRADRQSKFTRNLNALDVILEANGLPQKTGNGADAPKWWREGQYARVLNYCQNDVLITKALFEHITAHRGHIRRVNGPLAIGYVDPEGALCPPDAVTQREQGY